MNTEHIKFAAELGSLVARAKLAFERPDLDEKFGFWKDLDESEKAKLLNMDLDFSTATEN